MRYRVILPLVTAILGFLIIPWLGPKHTEPRATSVPKAKLGHTVLRALSVPKAELGHTELHALSVPKAKLGQFISVPYNSGWECVKIGFLYNFGHNYILSFLDNTGKNEGS